MEFDHLEYKGCFYVPVALICYGRPIGASFIEYELRRVYAATC